MTTAFKLHASTHQTEDKPLASFIAEAFYNDDDGPETFQHVDMFYGARGLGNPYCRDHVRLKFKDETEMYDFFGWLAFVFGGPIEIDLCKTRCEFEFEVCHPKT